MGGVAPLFAVEVHARVAGVAVGPVLRAFLGLEAFQAGPGVDQRAVHGEVRVADPAVFAGQLDDAGEEDLGRLVREEAVLVLAEGAVVPHGVEEVEVEEPAEQEIILLRLDQEGLAADGVKGLQHLGLEQAFGRDRRPAQLGMHLLEEGAEVGQRPVQQRLDAPQRVVLGHTPLGRDQAQHVRLGIDFSAHPLPTPQPQTRFNPKATFSMSC